MLIVQLLDPESPHAELCRLYWVQPPRPTRRKSFVHRADALAARAGVGRMALARLVGQHAFAYRTDWICESCHRPVVLWNRSDYEAELHSGAHECMRCTLPRALAFHERWIEEAPADPESVRLHRAMQRKVEEIREELARQPQI